MCSCADLCVLHVTCEPTGVCTHVEHSTCITCILHFIDALCPLHVLCIHQRPHVSCAAHRVALPVHVISSAHTYMCTRLLLDSPMHTHMCTIMTVSPAYQDPVHMHVTYHNINAHMYDAAHHHHTHESNTETDMYTRHITHVTHAYCSGSRPFPPITCV